MPRLHNPLAWALKGNQSTLETPEQVGEAWNLTNLNFPAFLKGRPWNIPVVVTVVAAHLAGLMAFSMPFSWTYLPVAIAFYLWFGFSVTLYLHRHLTHKGFEMAEPLRFLGAVGSVVGLSGDPVGWVGDHRHHHRASDGANDLHSPRQVGFFGAHAGWFLHDISPIAIRTRELAKDVRQDSYNRAFEKPPVLFLTHAAVAIPVWLFLGTPGLLWSFYLPLMLMHHVTWSINSFCHLRWAGYRNHETPDDSMNVPLFGILALGEGYHNNHHAQPRASAHGTRWFEFDPTKMLIWAFSKVGLVRNVVW